MRWYDPRVLVATAAANTGIDQRELNHVLRVGFPRCLTTLIQERGRNARVEGMLGLYTIHSDWTMFVKILLSVLTPGTSQSNEPEDHEFVNSMIESRSPERRRTAAAERSNNTARPLTWSQKRDNIVAAYDNLIEVLNFLFMPTWGCVHLRAEWWLSTKRNTKMTPTFLADNAPCGTQCYICTGEYKQFMLPVVKSGAIDFLASSYFSDGIPYVIGYENAESVPDKLWNDKDWRAKVFGKKTVKKYNIHAFMFQLIAAGILGFEWSNNTKEVKCVLLRDVNDRFVYLSEDAWEGFEFRREMEDA